MSTIEIQHISKAFGKVEALQDITTTLHDGKICGLLGRNGAGKTTLLNILTNRLFADRGLITIDGEPTIENDRVQEKIFYMTEDTLYPRELRVRDVFRLTQGFYPSFDMAYAKGLAERFKLDTGKKISALSTGYLSIFKLILTLAANTPIIIFDEPVLGLDANHRDLFYKELIAHYAVSPCTVILSTHLIDEAADLIEEVVMLKEGKLLMTDAAEAILQKAYTVSGEQEAVNRYIAGKRVIREESLGRLKTATLFQKRSAVDQNDLVHLGLDLTPARLQELFINLTN